MKLTTKLASVESLYFSIINYYINTFYNTRTNQIKLYSRYTKQKVIRSTKQVNLNNEINRY